MRPLRGGSPPSRPPSPRPERLYNAGSTTRPSTRRLGGVDAWISRVGRRRGPGPRRARTSSGSRRAALRGPRRRARRRSAPSPVGARPRATRSICSSGSVRRCTSGDVRRRRRGLRHARSDGRRACDAAIGPAARLVGDRARSRRRRRDPQDRRIPVFARIVDRMEEELRDDPAARSPTTGCVVGARGAGDLDRAWDAAIAGWVRASLGPDAAALRARPRSPRHRGADPRARPHASCARATGGDRRRCGRSGIRSRRQWK